MSLHCINFAITDFLSAVNFIASYISLSVRVMNDRPEPIMLLELPIMLLSIIPKTKPIMLKIMILRFAISS